MAFPQDPLPIKQELLINGVWTDITSRTREASDVVITRGYSAEQASLSAAQATFTLNNRDGLFSNRNPRSTYYGLLGRNTQYRTGVTETSPWLSLRDYSVTSTSAYDGAEASTADKGVLDVTGDIDLRFDIEPDNWRTGIHTVLGAKLWIAGTPPQQSWFVSLRSDGKIYFLWTADGSTYRAVQSGPAAATSGRIAVRVTLDVDNGAGGCTANFYTAPTISGTWTALGAAVVLTGTTSIYSSSSPIEIGDFNNGTGRGSTFGEYNPFVGRIYAFEMRNGIGGTLVAKMDATAQTPGTTSWSDGLATPNTWTLSASAAITNTDYRFWGEVSKLPQRWDSTGTDVYVPVQAADLVQRLSQGQKALSSPIYRNLSQYSTAGTASGYFPLESGETNATKISAVVGKGGGLIAGSFGTDATLPGAAGVLTFNDDTGYTSGAAVSGSNTLIAYNLFYFKMPSVPVSNTNVMTFYYTGTAARLDVVVYSTGYQFNIYDSSGTQISTNSYLFGTGAQPNQWIGMRILITQVGANLTMDYGWYPIGSPVFYVVSASLAAYTIGRPKSFTSYGWAGKPGFSLAHVVLAKSDLGFVNFSFYGSSNGYRGETAGVRAARLSREEGVPFWLVGNASDGVNAPMGAQGLNTYFDLLQECADVSNSLIYSPRDKFGIAMRLPAALRNQEPVTLTYTSKHLSGQLQPDEDDALIRNDVTVSRPNGGFGRNVKTSGALNVNEPATDPNGVGIYDSSITLNANSDDQCLSLAEREVFLGTWDELRYKAVQVNLERSPYVASATLTRAVRSLDIGDPIKIAGLPAWLPPDDVELLILGYTETLRNRGQEIIWNTAPYGPYRALNDLTGSTQSRRRAGASNSTTSGTLTTTATSMTVATPTGKLWGSTAKKPGNFPLDIFVAGERMTVTAIVGTSSPQTFTVTRSVNGVVKSHVAGETVQVADFFYTGLF